MIGAGEILLGVAALAALWLGVEKARTGRLPPGRARALGILVAVFAAVGGYLTFLA